MVLRHKPRTFRSRDFRSQWWGRGPSGQKVRGEPHPTASELRQDPVTGKWVVIASGRAKRPKDVASTMAAHPPLPAYVERCPFCNFHDFPQEPDTLVLPRRGKNWRVRAFPNKFPAFVPQDHARAWKVGPYTAMEGVGFHEVIITRPHNGFLFQLPERDLLLYLRAWRERYQSLMVRPSVAYIQIIENHGRASGGSLEHSHAQLFAVPILPRDEIIDLLTGAERYFRENTTCAYCDIVEFEREQTVRLTVENDRFVAFAPFASRVPYEQWVVPKEHAAGFEQLTDDDLPLFAAALQAALRCLARAFHDPPYNLYLYSAPCDTEGYVCEKDTFSHFHWHAQILPRLNTWGGFEIATGMEIVSALPEAAAEFLRSSTAP